MSAYPIKHEQFEKLIKAYMADPLNNYVLDQKGPVVRFEIYETEQAAKGWSVHFYCEKEPGRSFDLWITPEDLLSWMWENSARVQPHG
ncbi:hypothetical protein [Pseudomonas serbica]|jgi:hypothetical protein|uniref:hypothetical protein n=1 Tax=Pseudomonas serbica TaxID=2965074 RepID=UPI00237C1C97|nr:hypothetical protein [Pseudomonas serbica]